MFSADEEFVYSKALYMSAPRIVELEERQRTILRGTWDILTKEQGVGERIFTLIFVQQPLIKHLFPFIQHSADGEVLVNKQLKEHALRYMEVFGTIIKALSYEGRCDPTHLDSVMPVITNLGGIHVRAIERSGTHRRLQSSYWQTFEECTLIVFRKMLKRHSLACDQLDESMILWRCVLDWVIDNMQRTFLEKSGENTTRASNDF